MQHEITKAIPLLDANGNLTEPGWARSLLPVYRRADIRAGKLRIKEWDYYLISNGRFALALTIADNGYMGMDSVSIIELEEGWEITTSPMSLLPMGRLKLPEHSAKGVSEHAGKGHKLKFTAFGDGRRVLTAHMDRFGDKGALDALIQLSGEPAESMVIATPFSKPKHFYYNQKINCMRAKGWFTYGGQTWHFSDHDSFAVLDWGRGVWTYHNTWYWGSASYQVDGVPFKLSQVRFHIPGEEKDFLSPWHFSSDDGRFEMDFRPILDRASCTDVGVIKSDQHQVFGNFTGKAVLDDGTVVKVRDFPGFAEKVENKW